MRGPATCPLCVVQVQRPPDRVQHRIRAPIAQRGKAKQKRTDLRLIGLGPVVTRARGIPLVWHAYPGNRPDVTQFPALIDHLARRYAALPGSSTTTWPPTSGHCSTRTTCNDGHTSNGLGHRNEHPPHHP